MLHKKCLNQFRRVASLSIQNHVEVTPETTQVCLHYYKAKANSATFVLYILMLRNFCAESEHLRKSFILEKWLEK